MTDGVSGKRPLLQRVLSVYEKAARLIEIEGWLEKQGDIVKSWRERYCVLTSRTEPSARAAGSQILYYYKEPVHPDELTISPRGSFPMARAKIELIDVPERKFCFTVTPEGSKRTYRFSARTEESRRQWVSSLMLAAGYPQHEVDRVVSAAPTDSAAAAPDAAPVAATSAPPS